MLIEIHMIQNHSPANLNRDDLGAPKTCVFGGVTRARISSQCLKRSIRNPGNTEDIHNREPGYFAREMSEYVGRRTKLFPWLVQEALKKIDIPEDEKRRLVKAAQRIATSKEKDERGRSAQKKADDRPMTPQLIYLGPGEEDAFVHQLLVLRQSKKEHYDYFLNPIVGFQEIVESHLGDIDDDNKGKIVKASWTIAKCRMKAILKATDDEQETAEPQFDEDGQPGEAHAKLIAERLVLMLKTKSEGYKDLLKGPTKEERAILKEDAPTKPKDMEKFIGRLKMTIGGKSVDMGLFGRMTTSEAFDDVEAAMQVAHAISTHEVTNEVDYFTAVDDLGRGAGAGHVDEAQYASACFYKYFCLEWDQLLYNLTPEDKRRNGIDGKWDAKKATEDVKTLAAATLGHLVLAAAQSNPSGKQNSFAAHNLPDGILVEIKREGKVPVSYANAFADPVLPKSARGLVGQSIAQLGQYVQEVVESYGVEAERYWFSRGGRYPLIWEDRAAKDTEKVKPVVQAPENNLRSIDDLVKAVVKAAAAKEWSDVKDAGKAPPKEA